MRVQMNRLLAIIVMCINAQFCRADDKADKLRDLVRLPGMTISVNFSYTIDSGYHLTTEGHDSSDTVQSLTSTLRGDASDAIKYYRIGNLHFDANNVVAAKAAWIKSLQLYGQQLKLSPNDGDIEAEKALVFHQLERKTERDQAISTAVAQKVQSGRARDVRAELEVADAVTTLSDHTENLDHALDYRSLVKLLRAKPSGEHIQAALSLLNEAQLDLKLAVAASPRDSHVYGDIWLLRGIIIMYTDLLNEFQQNGALGDDAEARASANFTRSLMDKEVNDGMIVAARNSGNDPVPIGLAAWFILLAEVRDKQPSESSEILKLFSEPDSKLELEFMTRLKTLIGNTNPKIAGLSALTLGILQTMLLTPAVGRDTLTKAAKLLPDDPRVVEAIAITYLSEKKYDSMQQLMETAVKRHESVRWRILLAKTEAKQKKWDLVERDIRAALHLEPNNLVANLAMAAVELHSEKDAASLKLASEQLIKARKLLPKEPTSDETASLNYLEAIYDGLSGNDAAGRAALQNQAGGTDDETADIKAVLALLTG